jgi:hypothetical protein
VQTLSPRRLEIGSGSQLALDGWTLVIKLVPSVDPDVRGSDARQPEFQMGTGYADGVSYGIALLFNVSADAGMPHVRLSILCELLHTRVGKEMVGVRCERR